VFGDRRGAPRQGQLIPKSRAKLWFHAFTQPEQSLQGLDSFSHLWIIVLLHDNTNADKLFSDKSIRSKICPPRLKGDKTGIYSTRTPHRHNPIGLSLAKIEKVDLEQGSVLVSGLDFISGTPILDIKPFIPQYDAAIGEQVATPFWIQDADCLLLSGVEYSERAVQGFSESFRAVQLYETESEAKDALTEILRMDLRPRNKRTYPDKHEVCSIIFDGILVQFTVDDETRMVSVVECSVSK
jgi:tRNA-Thr(GGU) m(6)t(6)A37 methyltransferase TsaA